MTAQHEGLKLVDGPADVPEFATDDEETDFWDTHDFSERFWKGATRGSPVQPRAASPVQGAPQNQSSSSAFTAGVIVGGAGVIVGGALVLGAVYLLIQALKSKPVAPALLAFPPRGAVLHDLTRLAG